MEYTFEILGISPVLSFFNHQNSLSHRPSPRAAYLGAYRCTLDAFLSSVESVPADDRGWNLDAIVDTVIHFWINNGEQVSRWKARLDDAGDQNVLVARVADIPTLRSEFEALLGSNPDL